MSNKSNNQKNVNASVSNQKDAGLQKINLSKFASALDAIPMKEKKEKSVMYVYPEGMTKEQINSDAGKSFRGSKRRKMELLCNNILFSAKKNPENLQKCIDAFEKEYKEFYSMNDYSLHSISRKKEESAILSLALQIVKETK